MSVHAIAWALDRDVSATGAKFVLVALANYADENGIAYPSQARLAKLTSQSERAVRGHLATLEKQGFIKRAHRHAKNGARTSDIYELSYRQNLPQAESATGKKRHNLPAESAREPKEEEPKGIDKEMRAREFATWWKEYPNKSSGPSSAEKSYMKARKRGVSADTLMDGLQRYKAAKPDWQKWAHATTWLNQARWEAEYEVENDRTGNNKTRKSPHDKMLSGFLAAAGDG